MRPLVSCVLAVFTCASFAQTPPPAAPLGKVTEVKGLVTMSFGAQVATVQQSTPVFDGARLLSSSSGEVKIDLDGCVVTLHPNQMVTISSAFTSCQQQIAAIQLVGDSNVAAAGLFSRGGTALPLLGAALMAGAVARVKDGEITPRHPD